METKGKHSERRKYLLWGVLVLAIGATIFIWYQYFGGKSVDKVVVEQAPPPSPTDAVTSQDAKDILAAIEIIKNVTLDTEFFNDKKFADLEEFSVSIPDVQPRQQSFKLIFTPAITPQKK